jgi:hypothetical protein
MTAIPLDHSTRTLRRLLWVIWAAILLGLLMQALILVCRMSAGAPFPGLKWLPDVLGGVTWSVIVCGGVALGVLVAEVRAVLMGALGFVAAPLAFTCAKGVQRGVQSLVEAPVDKLGPVFFAMAGVKAVEYAVLGGLLALLLLKSPNRLWAFLGIGAAVGAVFGGANLALNLWLSSPKPPALAGMAANELLFPLGCAVVIYLSFHAGRHVKAIRATAAPA